LVSRIKESLHQIELHSLKHPRSKGSKGFRKKAWKKTMGKLHHTLRVCWQRASGVAVLYSLIPKDFNVKNTEIYMTFPTVDEQKKLTPARFRKLQSVYVETRAVLYPDEYTTTDIKWKHTTRLRQTLIAERGKAVQAHKTGLKQQKRKRKKERRREAAWEAEGIPHCDVFVM
jgi:hypothetical protein